MNKDDDQAAAGGNSSFGNPNRPKDIQGDESIVTPPVDDKAAEKAGDAGKPAGKEKPAAVHGGIGDGDIHKPN